MDSFSRTPCRQQRLIGHLSLVDGRRRRPPGWIHAARTGVHYAHINPLKVALSRPMRQRLMRTVGYLVHSASQRQCEFVARLDLSLHTLGRRFPLRFAAGARESYWAHKWGMDRDAIPSWKGRGIAAQRPGREDLGRPGEPSHLERLVVEWVMRTHDRTTSPIAAA